MTTTLKRVIGLLLVTGSYAVLTVLLAGCGGGGSDEGPPVAAPPRTVTVTTTVTRTETMPACAAAVEPLGTESLAYGAAARRDLRVYYRPGGKPGERFRKLNLN